MNNILFVLAALATIWSLLFVGGIAANIRGHRLKGRTALESLLIEGLVWVLGAFVILGTFNLVWGKIVPALEKDTASDSAPDLSGFRCLFGGCQEDSAPPPQSYFPTPSPNAPQFFPTPSVGDQLVRDYRAADGTAKCLFTADTGDSGGANIIGLADKLGIKCVVIAGDVIYPNGSLENFHSVVEPYLSPRITSQDVFVVPGNHDWWRGYPNDVSVSWIAAELPLCQAFPYLPQGQGKCRYYRLVLSPDVEVFFFDTDFREPDGNTKGSVQANWLQAALATSPARWKLVVTHEPPISSCQHDGNSGIASLPLRDWGASALFTGHCHFYERSDWNGLPVFTVGNGGNSIYQFQRVNPFSQFRWNQNQGAVVMTATATSLKFDFVTTSGIVMDSLTLSK